MKTKVFDLNGKEQGNIDLPNAFSRRPRDDIVSKVLETKKTEQPFSSAPMAGRQHSASGILVHRRHVWKSQYGRGISRVPRKILTRRGSQFNWVGAEVSNTVGGRKPHSPKVKARQKTKSINKKEGKIAFESALSATTDIKQITKKYGSLKNKKIEKNPPFILKSKLDNIKTKELISGLKKILGKDLFKVALRKKSVRSGRGKMRGRKYKKSAGVLIVIGNKENLKTTAFEIIDVKNLSVTDLAKGGLGRLTVYTEKAIEDIKQRLGGKK